MTNVALKNTVKLEVFVVTVQVLCYITQAFEHEAFVIGWVVKA